MNNKKLFILFLSIALSNLCAEPLLKLQSRYEAKYKNDEIKATVLEGARFNTDVLRAAVYAEQNPEHESISDTARYGFEARIKNVETKRIDFNFKADALNIEYKGVLSRLKNPEKLLTSSSALSTSLNAPRGIYASLPAITSTTQEKSVHFEGTAESENTTTYTDFTLLEKNDFLATIAESVMFGSALFSLSSTVYQTQSETKNDTALSIASKYITIVSAVDSVKDEKEIALTSTSAASLSLKTGDFGFMTLQGGYYRGTKRNKIKNMESAGIIYDFWQNRFRIGGRAIRTEKESEEYTKYVYGIRYREGNLALSLMLSDVQQKKTATFYVSDKVDTLRLSLKASASYDKATDIFTASARTGIQSDEYIFALWRAGASLKRKNDEITKRTADASITLTFGNKIKWIGKFSFNAEF